jgi:hypothetical protein
MEKGNLNLTLDRDLIDYAEIVAKENRTTVSELINQFILNLKRVRENNPTEFILSDPVFKESLLNTISKLRSGKINWRNYEEIFP